jgi:hypothetical protein
MLILPFSELCKLNPGGVRNAVGSGMEYQRVQSASNQGRQSLTEETPRSRKRRLFVPCHLASRIAKIITLLAAKSVHATETGSRSSMACPHLVFRRTHELGS